MTYTSCKKSDECNANVYGDVLRVQTLAHLCCALELVGNLEAALQQDSCDGETGPSCNVELACQNLYQYLYDNQCHLPSLDDNDEAPEDPQVTTSCLTTFGAYRYIDCICKKVPFLWRECALKAPEGDEGVVSIFELCKNESYEYGTTDDSNNTVQDFVEAVCCLKNHYLQIKSILEH